MIEQLISMQIAIELFILSILFYMGIKIEGFNAVSHQILNAIKELKEK